MDEQYTIRLTLLRIAAVMVVTDASKIFLVTNTGENTDNPSYAVAAV
jgi:hypothetical protein